MTDIFSSWDGLGGVEQRRFGVRQTLLSTIKRVSHIGMIDNLNNLDKLFIQL